MVTDRLRNEIKGGSDPLNWMSLWRIGWKLLQLRIQRAKKCGNVLGIFAPVKTLKREGALAGNSNDRRMCYIYRYVFSIWCQIKTRWSGKNAWCSIMPFPPKLIQSHRHSLIKEIGGAAQIILLGIRCGESKRHSKVSSCSYSNVKLNWTAVAKAVNQKPPRQQGGGFVDAWRWLLSPCCQNL